MDIMINGESLNTVLQVVIFGIVVSFGIIKLCRATQK